MAIDVYKTSDGKEFDERDYGGWVNAKNAAEQHQAELDRAGSSSSSSSSSSGGGGTYNYNYNTGGEANSRGDYDKAIEQCNREIASSVQHMGQVAVAFANRGNSYLNKQDYDQAIFDYTMAAGCHYNRGTGTSRVTDQRSLGDTSLATVFCNRGNIYSKKGKRDKAIADWKAAADCDPSNSGAVALKNLASEGIQYKPDRNSQTLQSILAEADQFVVDNWNNYHWKLRKEREASSSSSSSTSKKKGGAGKIIVWVIIAVAVSIGITIVQGLFSKPKTAATQTQTTTTNANVNFRAEPSTGDNIIRQLKKGDTVTLTGETNGGWTQILHNGDKGWVSTEYLEK